MKQSKLLLLLLVGFVLSFGGILWYSLQSSYFLFFPITYNKYKCPSINVQIGADTYDLEIRIGSRFPLFLNQETLKNLDKQHLGTTKSYKRTGECNELPTYLIPKINIANFTLTNVVAAQSQNEAPNSLGKNLGGALNLFLDFPHSRIIACDSFSKLKNKGFVNDQWIQMPFKMGLTGVILQVSSDLGTLNLSVETTMQNAFLKSSLMPVNQSFLSSSLWIEKCNLGKVLFQYLDLSDSFHDIDGFIGMNFLKNHAIYLDFSNNTAYIEPSPVYFEHFPVTFGPCHIPYTDIHIEGNTYSLEIDLGSNFLLSLDQEVLQNIHKTLYGTSKWLDFKGAEYQSPAYIISEIKLGNFLITDVLTSQDREDFHANVIFDSLPSKQIGSIGRPILEKYNLLLDFRRAAMYASNNCLPLQEAGILSKNLLTIPFILHPDGILLSIETDSGTQRLILDTGATRTAIRAPCPTSTSKFKLMNHDFGIRSIFPLEISPFNDYDGFLGMDFLREYSLFIDYYNKLIYIDLQKSE